MKKILALITVIAMVITSFGVVGFAEGYYINILSEEKSSGYFGFDLKWETNCPEMLLEVYYPEDSDKAGEVRYTFNFNEIILNAFNGEMRVEQARRDDPEGEYRVVLSYDDCIAETKFILEGAEAHWAWKDYIDNLFNGNNSNTNDTTEAATTTRHDSVRVSSVEVSENKIELYIADTRELEVTSSKSVTVEIEDEDVVEASLSDGVLTVKGLKQGQSEIWLRNSETYTAVSVTVLYGTNPDKEGGFYTDVAPDAECRRAVSVLSAMGIMQGYEDGTFKPEGTLTRAEAAAIMVRLINYETNATQGDTVFEDVSASHWASGYINVAVNEGIIHGIGDGTFKPDESVTYHELVKMLICVSGYEPYAMANGGWNNGGYILAASKIGLTKGIGGIQSESITREKTARLIFKALDIELMDGAYHYPIYGTMYDVLVGKTILTEYWDYQKIDALVKEISDGKVALRVELNYNEDVSDYAVGQLVTFETEDESIEFLVGKVVTAYVKKTKDAQNILLYAIEKTED